MNDLSNSLFIRALNRKPIERTPVWIMRQAGRYLPEYRELRAKAGDFLSLCKTKEYACEATLQPLRRFPLDAAILFSDILTIPDAMGLGLHFVEGEGPCFERPIRTIQEVDRLITPNEELHYVMDAVHLIRQEMPQDLPLIGFAGSPWTLACYMVEGESSREFKQIKEMLYKEPQTLQLLLAKLAEAVSLYLENQVAAGVNALMIFDTWGGILTPEAYQDFSLFYMQQIIRCLKKIHPQIPIILFTKGGGQWLSAMAASGCDALGLDWTTDIGQARATVGGQVALQGNMDPAVLRSNTSEIRRQVKQILASFGRGSGHVFNLGHGITPDVPPEHVQAMLDAVHEFSPSYHGDDHDSD